jgi:hypothetical protein
MFKRRMRMQGTRTLRRRRRMLKVLAADQILLASLMSATGVSSPCVVSSCHVFLDMDRIHTCS